MFNIVYTKRFGKDLAKVKKRKLPKSELDAVVKLLSENKQLPQKYKDHALSGKYGGYRECHIQPDWLLVYKKIKKI